MYKWESYYLYQSQHAPKCNLHPDEEWFLKYEPGSKKNNEKKGTITPDVLKFLKNTKKRIKINNKINKTKRKNKKNHKKHHKKKQI